jgi:hypothetical protein
MLLDSILNALQLRRTPKRTDCGYAGRRPRFEALEDRLTLSVSPATSFPFGASPREIVTADFNNDGQLDVAVANSLSNNVSVLLSNGNGTFQQAQTFALGANPVSLSVGDFNGDGKMDLVAAQRGTSGGSIALGNGDGTFRAPSGIGIAWEIDSEVESVAVGDFNEDGKLDLVAMLNEYVIDPVYWYQAHRHVLLGIGDGSFSTQGRWFLGGRAGSVVVGDFNGDGNQDFATDFSDAEIVVELGDGRVNFPQGSLAIMGGLDKAAGDLNGDGTDDLVTASGHDVQVLLGPLVPQNDVRYPEHYAAATEPSSVTLGDFDRDGLLDIAAASPGSNEVSVLRGRGDGTFSPAENFAVGSGASVTTNNDYNRDGTVDAADYVTWRSNGGSVNEYEAWRANFGESTAPGTDPRPVDLVAGDFNGDGWLDIATANANANSVSVLLNDQVWSDMPPRISIGDAMVTEGNTGNVNVTFTLTLSKATNADVTVRYSAANITATAGSDYVSASGVVRIPVGQTSATFTVAVIGDRLAEATETFAVNLSEATNATIGDGQGIGTILDNEPRISINDVARSEGNGNKTTLFTFTVTLSAAYDQPVTMSYRTVNGTATTANNDYNAKSGTLTFAPGETTKTITIEVKVDNKREASEAFYVDLFDNSVNSLFTKFRGIGTILNDD